MRLAILTCLLMSLTFVAQADSFGALKGRYKVDPSSTIHFSVAQMGGQAIEGWFRKFSGQFVLAGEDASGSTVQFTLSPASVETAVINGRLSAKGLTRDAKSTYAMKKGAAAVSNSMSPARYRERWSAWKSVRRSIPMWSCSTWELIGRRD